VKFSQQFCVWHRSVGAELEIADTLSLRLPREAWLSKNCHDWNPQRYRGLQKLNRRKYRLPLFFLRGTEQKAALSA